MKRVPAKTFKDLLVWKKAHKFVLLIYAYTAEFPENELYGLISQLRRAAVSIPANIAEGFKKRSKKEKARYMNIAQGSLEECRYYLILSHDLNYGDNDHIEDVLQEVSKLLYSYYTALKKEP